jgi:hypothetical protein
MSCAIEIAGAIAAALEETDDVTAELVALGMVASAVICTTSKDRHHELVETFCKVLRGSVGTELN